MCTKIKPPRWVVGCAIIGMAIHLTTAADFLEEFTTAPAPENWRIHGDSDLFQWNPAGHLDVTWDSSRTNSYFFHPLGTILAKDDDFTLAFDLTLRSVQAGHREGKPGTFELAIGFINQADATRTNFFRGKGTGTVRNLVEFDYFPDNGLGATVWPAVWSTNAVLSYRDANDYTLITLPLDTVLRLTMAYTGADRTWRTTITANGQPFGPINPLVLATTFTDFRVDTFAILSYSDAGTSSSLLATGEIDNVRLTLPTPPIQGLAIASGIGGFELSFLSRANWFYQAEMTSTFDGWQSTGSEVPGSGEVIGLPVSAGESPQFWRVRATRP